MSTAGDGSAPYESGGAGGKFRKKPFRRSIPATPYARPPTAVRNNNNNNPSMLKKLVDPASRLIYAGAHRLFDVFRKSLPPRSLGPPEMNEEPENIVQNEGGNGNSASISAATGISELEQMLQQKTFTRSEIQRLTSVLHSKTIESPSDDSLEKHGDKRDDFHAAISTPIVTSGVLKEEIGSPAELAKYYIGSRTTNQAHRRDSKLLPRTSITPVAQKTANSLGNLENGFVASRSRGRSAMYTMARSPYFGSPSTSSQQGIKSGYGHDAALTSSQGREGKMALKRRSSVLDDDIGSGSSLRRIRQKANLLSQREKKELGYTAFQQLDGAGQNLLLTDKPESTVSNYASVPTKATQTANKILQCLDKPSPIENNSVSTLARMKEKSPNELRLDMLHGQALKSLEKMDSPKFLPSCHDIQKPVVSELTFQSKNKTEENGLRKFPEPQNMLTLVNGDMPDTLKDKAPVVEITDLPSKVTEVPQKKHAFQMSAPEDSFEMDDDDDDIHDNGTSAAEIIKTPTLLEVSKTSEVVEYSKPLFPEVSKVPEQVKLKEAENDLCVFGFNSSAAATSTTSSQSQGSFFNITNGFQASGSTTSIFGSTWQQPQQQTSSGFSSTFTSPSSSVFSFGAPSTPAPSFMTAGASNSSFGGPSVFGNPTPVFVAPVSAPGFMFGSATPTPAPSLTPAPVSFSFGGQQNQAPPPQNPFQSSSVEFNAGGGSFSLGSGGEKSNRRIVRVIKNNNSDQMSMEDSMAEDSMQTHSPVSPFGQAPVSAPGFMFGSATPTPAPSLTPAPVSFLFGGQQNQTPPPQNLFQLSSVEFNAGGGSFSFGSGDEKSNRRIVRVIKNNNRKK